MTRPHQAAVASIALACAAFCAGAQAQSSVTIFGLVNVDAGQYQLAGQPRVKAVDSGRMSTSFIGFKGSEDLGGGLKAVFSLEHFLRADVGAAGRFNGDAFWARSAYVGIGSDYGAVTLGRTSTPLFVSTLVFNAIGDSFGYSPSIREYFGEAGPVAGTGGALLGDSGWNNSISYSSPKVMGAILSLSGSLGEGTAGAQGKNFGGNVIYYGGPLSASVAYQSVRNDSLAGWSPLIDNQKTFQLGGAYDFGFVKPYVQYGQVKTEPVAGAEIKTKIYGLGATVPIGAGKIMAQYGQSKRDGTSSKRQITTVGYDYPLSKKTDVYVLGMNDRVTGLSKGNSLMAGMRLTF
jgi:predicted porin